MLALAWVIAVVVIPLSLVFALVMRRRYVRAIVRYQSRGRTASDPATGTQPPPALRVVVSDLASAGPVDVTRSVLMFRRRALLARLIIYTVYWGGLLVLVWLGHAIFIAVSEAIRTGSLRPLRELFRLATLILEPKILKISPYPVWLTVLIMLMFFAAPPVFNFATQSAVSRRAVYLPTLALGVAFVAASAHFSPFALTGALTAVFATVAGMVALLQDSRIRGAAAPLIMSLAGSLVLWGAAFAVVALGTDGEVEESWGFVGIGVLVLLVVATCAAILLVLARSYRRKHYGDRELSGWAYWAVSSLLALGFAGVFAPQSTPAQVADLVAGLGIWVAANLLVTRIGGERLRRTAPASAGALVILRVFKRAARSESFVDRLLSFWRFAGPVLLIAGPDLAGANIEPDEFFDFLRGRLARRFIAAKGDIDPALASLDLQRDPDGRFRMTELFCAEAVWRETVTKLMAGARVVLLDLREYRPSRAGTRFEIRQLMSTASVPKVVVLLSAADDESAMVAELREAWDLMADDSPNRCATAPALEVCRFTSGSGREVSRLFSRLYQCARAP